MELNEVLNELKSLSDAGTKNTMMNHGAVEPIWGVRIGDMKPLFKRIKNNHSLAMQLFDSGISDAKYLAGMVANGQNMSRNELQKWVENSGWSMISEYTVPWVAAESSFGEVLALEWIDSDNESIACSGWNTLSGWVATRPDKDLDFMLYKALLDRISKTIGHEKNRVRYAMNGFVISVGSSIVSLTDLAMEMALSNGKIEVFMGNTCCKVPYAPDYIQKVIDKGRLGIKRKTMKCTP